MAIPKRNAHLCGTYFVTSRTWEGRALFTKETNCRIFLDALLRYRSEGAYLLHAFVLMPDHFHVLLTPAAQITLERCVQFIKGGSSHALCLDRDSHFPVWQRGFSDHCVRDHDDYQAHLRYIELNPVKRHLVALPGEYAWSSSSRSVAIDEPPAEFKSMRGVEGAATVRHG